MTEARWCHFMTTDHFRAKAREVLARADRETDERIRAELENIANYYLHIAEQEERKKGSPSAGCADATPQ
jgi:hypothetical protein